jgi:hypothetical protein
LLWQALVPHRVAVAELTMNLEVDAIERGNNPLVGWIGMFW